MIQAVNGEREKTVVQSIDRVERMKLDERVFKTKRGKKKISPENINYSSTGPCLLRMLCETKRDNVDRNE